MKVSLSLVLCLSQLNALSEVVESSVKVVERDSPTENELALKLKLGKPNTFNTTYTPPAASETNGRGGSEAFVTSSDILCYEDAVVLIPKRSVLLTPKSLSARSSASPNARLVSWEAFYPANRSWLATVEVSPEQTAGRVPISSDTMEALTKAGKVAVATHKGCPISVLQPAITADPVHSKPITPP